MIGLTPDNAVLETTSIAQIQLSCQTYPQLQTSGSVVFRNYFMLPEAKTFILIFGRCHSDSYR